MARSDTTSSPRHDGSRLVLSALLWVSVAVTFVTALAIGWFEVSFQLFGEKADRADYTTAVWVYAAGAGLLLLTPVVAWLFRLSPVSSLVAVTGAVVLALLSLDAAHAAAAMSPDLLDHSFYRQRATTLAALPWVWSLPALLLCGIVSRLRIFVVEPLRHTSLREDR